MHSVALITGASRGIGKAIAYSLAEEGYTLALCCKNQKERLLEIAADLNQNFHVSVLTFVGDVSDASFVEQMICDIVEEFGSIDILINNAGISYVGLLTDMDITDWNNVLSTNLTSCFLTSRYAIPSMLSKKEGKIINISSVWGNVGASCEVAYSASKGGIHAFTKALAKELAPSNIQVNAIACGVIDTDMNQCFSDEERKALTDEIPCGRMGQPKEVAELVLSLCKTNSYLTGQIITIDGGWI